MKIKKKIIKSLVAAIFCVSAITGLFTACKDGEDSSGSEKITYSFNVMGGASMEDVTLELGVQYTLPQPAAREGYAFEGWYLNENFEGAPITSVTVEANQTYYAKWVQMTKITIEVDGTQKVVYAKAGESLYEALKSYVPEKSGLTFGAWFSNNSALDAATTVAKTELVVTPKYKVAYTVEVYLENMDGTAYELSTQETVVGSEYVGVGYTSTKTVVGFKEDVQHTDRVVEKVLSATASENVFKHYFKRQTYNVTFVANAPDGKTYENETVSKKFNENDKIVMLEDYAAEGYCLIGWSRQPNATKPDFNVYYMDTVLENKGDGFQPRKPDAFEPNENDMENVRLYGVWVKGCIDMFDGDDYIYLFEEDGETVAYLCRGNRFFKGEYDEDYNEFFFRASDSSEIILSGKFYSNNTFAYYSEKRSGYIASLYSVGAGVEGTTQIEFDSANGITYKVKGQQDTIGTQRVNENGEYIADFTAATEGYMMGRTITFMTGTYDGQNAFIVLNEAERDMGTLKRFYYDQSNNSILTYQNGYFDISLDGYGVATYTGNNGATTNYYYTYEEGVITLLSQYGGLFGEAVVTTIKGETGYVLYNKWQDAVLNVQGGDTLELDGGINAKYTKGTEVFEGYYSTTSSNFGGYIIQMTTTEGEVYTFMVTGTLNDDGELEVGYRVNTVFNTYGEYRYLSDGMIYNAAMLVIDEEMQGRLSVYGYNSRANKFVKVSDGAYTKGEDEYEGYYLYEAENTYRQDDILTDPVDPSKVKSFVFALDDETTAYSIFYWESMKDNNDNTTQYVETYTCATDAEETSLKLVGGFAYYTLNGVTYSGAYVKYEEEGYLMILTSDATGSKAYYVEIDDVNKTFTPLDYEPYKAYLYAADGKVNNQEGKSSFLSFDGKGNASYVVDGGESVLGTVKETTEKTNNAIVYQFTSKDGTITFKYLLAAVSSNSVYLPYNEAYNGQYENENGRLNLDGYGYYGQYRDADENVYEGTYLVEKENVISLKDSATGKVFYFDLEGRNYTIRSEEYGSYLWIDNQGWIQETYFEFNGYGTLLVYTLKEVNNGDEVTTEREYICENGTYTQNGKVFTLTWTYDDNGEEKTVTLSGELGTYYGAKAFLVKLEGNAAIGLYVNAEDWSVLLLDDVGNAVKYGDEGEKELGYYTLITDTLLYYVNAANTDACLYEYDVNDRTATQVKFDEMRYLTEDMETLTFYEYGYLVIRDKDGNNERHYYYEDSETDMVTIYVFDPDNVNATAYGFVAKTLNGYTETLTFGEKEYYMNDGNSFLFNRQEETKNEYPLAISSPTAYAFDSLSFDVTSNIEFRVNGIISHNGNNLPCEVVREIDDEGNETTYVTVGDFRVYVEFTYKGLDELSNTESEYKIIGVEFYQKAYAYNYLVTAEQYAAFGYKIENTLGEITIHGSYNVDGTAENVCADAIFLENSALKDSEGTLIEFKDAVYNVDEEYHTATFEGKDGYTYSLHFALGQYKGVYAYQIVALARHQTFTYGNYEVLTERVVATELIRIKNGDLFNVTVKENGEPMNGKAITSSGAILFVDGKMYYAVRTKEGDRYTSATYYEITLESEASVDSVEGEMQIPLYKSITIKKADITISQIVYAESGKYFVEFTENGAVVITLVNETFIAVENEELTADEIEDAYQPKDDSTIVKAYMVTTSTNGRRFMVQIRTKTVDEQQVTYLYAQEIFE